MNIRPLNRREMISVIEGKGCAPRVPVMVHCWVSPDTFAGEKRAAVAEILSRYPMDAQIIPLNIPAIYDAPEDDPSYRWSYCDPRRDLSNVAIDSAGFIEDWDEELDKLVENKAIKD